MTVRFQSVLGALALLALTAAPTVSGQQGEDPDLMKQKQTITDSRTVGSAMYFWYQSEMLPKRSDEAHEKARAEASPIDITAVPVISREQLEKILVPKYLPAIPAQDGWGHPYEFRLNTANPDAVHMMGLRSAGRDGQFSGNVYEVGAFSPPEYDQDVVWVDGYFMRWPQKK